MIAQLIINCCSHVETLSLFFSFFAGCLQEHGLCNDDEACFDGKLDTYTYVKYLSLAPFYRSVHCKRNIIQLKNLTYLEEGVDVYFQFQGSWWG